MSGQERTPQNAHEVLERIEYLEWNAATKRGEAEHGGLLEPEKDRRASEARAMDREASALRESLKGYRAEPRATLELERRLEAFEVWLSSVQEEAQTIKAQRDKDVAYAKRRRRTRGLVKGAEKDQAWVGGRLEAFGDVAAHLGEVRRERRGPGDPLPSPFDPALWEILEVDVVGVNVLMGRGWEGRVRGPMGPVAFEGDWTVTVHQDGYQVARGERREGAVVWTDYSPRGPKEVRFFEALGGHLIKAVDCPEEEDAPPPASASDEDMEEAGFGDWIYESKKVAQDTADHHRRVLRIKEEQDTFDVPAMRADVADKEGRLAVWNEVGTQWKAVEKQLDERSNFRLVRDLEMRMRRVRVELTRRKAPVEAWRQLAHVVTVVETVRDILREDR